MSSPAPSDQAPAAKQPWRGGRLPRHEVERRIDAMLDIAGEEFGRHGFGGTSLDSIVARSGVSKTTIFRRFGNKEGLFRTLIVRTIVAIREDLCAVALDPDNPEGTIAGFVRSYVEIAICNPLGHVLLAVAILERRAAPALGAMILSHAAEGLQPIAEFFDRLMTLGILRRGDPLEAAFDLQGLMTQGFRVLVDDRSFLARPGRAEEIARRFMKGWS